MTDYPASFPCASRIEGHSQTMNAGLVRTPMEAGNARQRRTHRVLPHRISLVFMVHQPDYAGWLTWINASAWDDWIAMRLPGLAASAGGTDTTPIAVRFMSDLQADLVPVHRLWYWRVRVEAEYLPTPAQLAPVFGGVWIIGGRPGSPSLDWMVAGSLSGPSTDWTAPGTPAAPSVIA